MQQRPVALGPADC